jgi:hypothetical protein
MVMFALPDNDRIHIAMSSTVTKVPQLYLEGSGYQLSDPGYILTREEWGRDFDDLRNTLQVYRNLYAYTCDDTSGCRLAIAYKSNAKDVLPENFVIFSVVLDCPKG